MIAAMRKLRFQAMKLDPVVGALNPVYIFGSSGDCTICV